MMSGTLTHNKGQIYYETTGSGKTIVFIHGFTLDRTMWRLQAEFFSKNYRVVTYDARGFGESSPPDGPYDHAADLCALFEHLGIAQAHVVGLSMGGRIALNFTLANPEMVMSLTLMNPGLDGYENEIDFNVHAKEQGIEKAKENWFNHELFAITRKQKEAAKALSSIIENYSGWHWLHLDPRSPANTHARDRLHEITKPTIIIVGESDLAYLHNVSSVLAAGISGARKVTIPKAGHMVNMEAPDDVNELVADFIAEVLTRGE